MFLVLQYLRGRLEQRFPSPLSLRDNFGAGCLRKWLKDFGSCLYCRMTVFNPYREAILKGVLRLGKIFLAEMVLDTNSGQSYGVFKM